MFAGSVADHLQAGVHNLCPTAGSTNTKGTTDTTDAAQQPRKFLEQSVFADGLSPESVQQLNLLANTLWAQVLQQVVQAATPLCAQDQGHPQPQRFRLGLFSFAAPEFKNTSSES